MKKTLGGDRLGSGAKMEVDLHNYGRSTHDLGYVWRSTMAAGTLVPFMVEVGLPGDTFDITLDMDVKTHPTVGPLFGSFKTQADVFLCPIRNYQGRLHNNALGIGRNMANVKLPIMELTAYNTRTAEDVDNAQINPSCILAYLGVRGVGTIAADEIATATRSFNACSFLSYWDIVKNYYANKQEEIGAVIHTGRQTVNETVTTVYINVVEDDIPEDPAREIRGVNENDAVVVTYTGDAPLTTDVLLYVNNSFWEPISTLLKDITVDGAAIYGLWDFENWGSGTISAWRYIQPNELPVGPPRVQTFPLENIDKMRDGLLGDATETAARIINDYNLTPYNYVLEPEEGLSNMVNTQEGLALKTYQSDLFNNWLSTEWIDGVDGISQITAVSTAGDEFTIDTLNLANKIFNMLNRIVVSGGSYDDWLNAVYTHDRIRTMEIPVYQGSLIKELVFQEVVSNAEASGSEGTQPLGTLAGKGVMARKHKGGKIRVKVDEPSYVMGIVSLTPRIDYSQGNRWDIHLRTMDDFYKPALAEIGFQDLIAEQMAYWTTNKIGAVWVQAAVGKQPAWVNYMTNYNRTYGNFAIEKNEMFMTNNRRYEVNKGASSVPFTMKDMTTYIDPSKFNHIFAQTSLDSQNFWVQMSVDITARRKMSAKIMPNL